MTTKKKTGDFLLHEKVRKLPLAITDYNKNQEEYQNQSLEMMELHMKCHDYKKGGEYVTRGSVISCIYGKDQVRLDAQTDHGVYTENGDAILTCNDCKFELNIPGFGTCSCPNPAITGKKCLPVISGTWLQNDSRLQIYKDHSEYSAGLKKDAVLVCSYGAYIQINEIHHRVTSKKTLKEELRSHYETDIGMKWRRVYDSDQAIDIILKYDDIITQAADQYGLKKSFIQSILYRELYCIGYEDDMVDNVVKQTHYYEQAMEDWKNYPLWKQVLIGPPSVPIPYRLDSSTGYGQIFGKTAIAANNWGVTSGLIKGKIYNADNKFDLIKMWNKLYIDAEFNLNMAGLVLRYEAARIGVVNIHEITPEQTVRMLAKYNGSTSYGETVYKYVAIFDRYN